MSSKWSCGILIGACLWGAGAAAQAQTPRPGDIAAKLDPSSLVSLSMDGASTNLDVRDSTASIALVTPKCVPTALGCLAEIEGFRIDLSSFAMDTTVGHFQIANPSLNIVGPVVAKDTGSGYVVPAGTVMAFSGNVSADLNDEHTVGPVLTNETTALASPVTFTLSTATQDLTIDGSFPFQLAGTQGDTVTGTVTIMATGQKPFLNTPPNANAGPDQTVSCGQQVTLDGSQSIDVENNITTYLWSANGNIIATGPVAHVNLPSGTTSIQLNVQDSFFASGVDLMTVASQEAAPVFTFLPPALQVNGCGPQKRSTRI